MARLADPSQQARPIPRNIGMVSRSPAIRAAVVGSAGPGFDALGGSLIKGGEELYQTSLFEADKVDTLRAEEAYNQFLMKKMDLTLGEDGFTKMRGSEAVAKPVYNDYTKQLEDAQRGIASGLGNDEQRRRFTARADVGTLQYKEDILRHLASEGEAYAKDTYDGTIAFEQASAKQDWAKPGQVNSSLNRIKAATDRRADDQGWTKEQRAEEHRVQESVIRSSVAQSMMMVAPIAARKYMDDYEDKIDPANFKILRGQYISELDRHDRLADKALKKSQDLQEGHRLLGILDPKPGQQIDETVLNADLATNGITNEAYNRLRKVLKGDSIIDDTQTVMNLDLQAGEGTDDLMLNIMTAVSSHAIKPDTGAQIYRRGLSAQQTGGPMARSDVKSARKFVDGLVGGVRGPLAILDSASSERVVRATAEFDRRMADALEDNPNADPMAIAEDVANRYRLTPPSATAFPRPMYLVGTRSKPDFLATKKATLAALDAGGITQEEATAELENLKDIAAAAEEREERKGSRKP